MSACRRKCAKGSGCPNCDLTLYPPFDYPTVRHMAYQSGDPRWIWLADYAQGLRDRIEVGEGSEIPICPECNGTLTGKVEVEWNGEQHHPCQCPPEAKCLTCGLMQPGNVCADCGRSTKVVKGGDE